MMRRVVNGIADSPAGAKVSV
eukprot:COSAG02_NODE_28571_length_587_cov_0.844262_1_plen_20_part_10